MNSRYILIMEILDIIHLGGNIGKVTFMHPYLALDYAGYLNSTLAVQINVWMYRYISGDRTLVPEVLARADEVDGKTSMLTLTVAEADQSRAELAAAHAQTAAAQAEVVRLTTDLERKLADLVIRNQQNAAEEQQKIARLQTNIQKLERQNLRMYGTIRQHKETLARQHATEVEYLERELAALTADLTHANLDISKKKRKLCQIKHTLHQTGGATSKPLRLLALRNATAATDGKTDKLAHDLIKDAFSGMGALLRKYCVNEGFCRRTMLDAVATIIGRAVTDQPGSPLSSNVFLTNLICGNVKDMLGLENSTHCTLGDLHRFVTNCNHWFASKQLVGEFHLAQQAELDDICGHVCVPVLQPAVRVVNDIRQFMRVRI